MSVGTQFLQAVAEQGVVVEENAGMMRKHDLMILAVLNRHLTIDLNA